MAQDPQLFIDENVIGQELGVSLDLAGRSGTAPEQESQLRVASKRLGIPLDSARTDPQKTLQVAKDAEFNPTDYAKRFPNAARFLADQSNALIARDDVRPLSEVEQRVVSMVKEQQYGSALNPVAATIMRLMPERAAAEEEVRQTLRTQGFAAASAKRREIDERMSYGQPTGIAAPMEGPAPSVGSVASGMLTSLTGGAKQARVSGQLAINDLFNTLGAQPNDVYTRDLMRKYQQETARIEASTPAFESSTGRGLYAGAQSLARQAPGLAVSVATGTTLPALAAAGANTAGEAYGRYRSRGATPGEAALGTGGETAVEILTERLPMKFVVDNLGKAGFGEFLRGFLGRELITEQIATIAQDAIDTAVANPNKTWAEYWAERPDAAYQTALATLVQSGAIGAVNTVLTNTVGRAEMQRREQERAFTGAAQLEQLLAAAAESQTRVRAPESFSQLVQQAAVSSGAVSEVYFDARPLVDVLEQSGMTPEQIEQLLPSVADTLGEAVVTNGTVAIPVGELTTAFAGSGVEQALLQHARTTPDAQSVADAEQSQELLAQLQQDAEQALAQQQERAAWEASSQEVFDNILGQLSTAGRFSQDVSKAQATVVRDFFTVMAARTGTTPAELYQRYPLRVTARNPVGGEQLAQGPFAGFTREQFLGNPTITKDSNASTLQPRVLTTVDTAPVEPFAVGEGLTAKYSPDGAAVFDGDKVIASYNFGDTLVVDKKYRRQGIAAELVYQYRTRNPNAKPARERTKKSQALQEKVWERIEREMSAALNQSPRQSDLQRALAMSEDEYIAAVNPTNARDTEDEGVVLSLGDLDTPSNATQIAAFQDADGNDVQVMRDGNGTMYAVRDGETLGSIGAFEDGTGIQLVREAQGKGIGRRLTMEYLRENPFAPAGSFTAAGEANRRSAFRALQAEQGVLNQSAARKFTAPEDAATGKPMTVYFARNTVSAKNSAPAGMDFGQKIEPAGEYMVVQDSDMSGQGGDGWVYGTVTFKNPLVLEHKSTNSTGWKKDLSEMFGGKTGKALSNEVKKAGYDGVVTRDKYGYSETVNLAGDKGGVLNQSVPQTETEAFKRWFGDSKVVDANGKPLVVYHGTRGDFDAFDTEKSLTGGVFFTEDKRLAGGYTLGKGSPNVVPVYLSIQNPKRVEFSADQYSVPLYEKQAIEQAKAEGHDGLIASAPERDDMYIAFRPEQIKSAIGNRGTFDPNDPSILNQGEAARATFSPGTLEIALLERADLSSFLHELGHFYFEVLADIASQPGAPQQIVDDMGALLQAAGFEGTAAEWLQQPLDTRRDAHEMVAESFEQYLFDGKAPSLEQQRLFNRLRAWMVSVYRTIAEFLQTNRNAQLSDEVRGVFDRMLATDAQIEVARAARQFGPMFESAEQAGMSPEEFAAYQEQQQAEIDDATRDLDARRLRDMRWLQNYRGKKLRELQKDARARRKAVQEEVTKEVDAMPVYETLAFIRSGRLPNGVEKPAGIESTRINRGAVESMYGEQFKVPDRLLSRNGLDPEAIVALLPGRFDSGDEMVRAVSNAEPRVQLIEAMTDQRMLERYGDLATPEDIERAADAAIANDAHTRMVATELGAVTKQLGSVQAIRRASREFAERQTGSRAIKYLRPDQAAADAARQRKAADVALRKGDTEAVVEAKRNELLSLELQRAQTKAKEEIVKARNDMQRLWGKDEQKAKTRDMNLVNAARAIVAQYGIAPERAGNTALAYIELVRQYDAELATNLQMLIDQAPEPKPFKDLTVDEFRALRDVVGSLWFMSKRTKQIEIDGQKLDMDEVAGELVERVVEINDGELPPLPGYTSTPTKFDHLKKGTLGMLAMGRRVESWADGMGPVFTRYIWNPVSESVTRYRGKRNEMVGKYRDLLKSIEPGLTYRPIHAPELGPEGFTFNAGKSEVLHALLHSGNSSNLRKLLVGRGWGTVDENTGVLDTSRWDAFVNRMVAEGQITKADFDFVQGVWDLLESIKADAQRAHREIYGYYFNEVTAEPIQTPFGEYRGGYVPAVADPISSPDQAQKIEAEQANAVGNSYMFPTTGRGFTMARVEYNRPLMLDLRTLASHIDKVARFAFIEPAVRDVGKLLQNKRVARAINGHDQGAISSMLMPWLQRAAQQTVALPGKNKYSDKFFNSLRARSGMFLMFGNVVNTLQQVTGFSVAALKVPAPRLARATYHYLRNPAKAAADASELSPWLADRLSNQSFEMQQAIQDVLIDPNVYQKADAFMKRNAYFMQQAVQNVMDVIVWHGAYDRAIGLGLNEKAAVREADNAVRTTQGSFAPEDVSAIEVQTPFVRLFTQFWGYFNMLANTMGTEAGKAMRDLGYMASTRRLAFIWFAGLAVPAFVAELIARGAPGDDEDEDGDGVLDEWLAMFFGSQVRTVTAMVPVAGQAAQLGFNQLDDKWYNDRLNISPSLSLAESAASAVGNLLQGDAFDERLTKKEVRDTATLIGLATGMPTNVVAKPVGYLLDVEAGKKQPEGVVDYAIGLTTGR